MNLGLPSDTFPLGAIILTFPSLDLIAESALESKIVDLAEDRIMLSSDELNNNLLEFKII